MFASISGIHKAITKLVLHNSMYLSSKACHVIYIASFANSVNHQRFANIGAIDALSKIIKQENLAEDQSPRLAAQGMWASAALANLAASYCETDEGRCYWEWYSDVDTLVRWSPRLHFLVSDRSWIRKKIIMDKTLI
jgi:hypothetical protein